MAQNEYVLGSDVPETERLRFQHASWREATHALWRRAGLVEGMQALDFGCGPGFATADLALVVGARGRVLALDRSERFLALLRERSAREALPWIETVQAEAQAVELESASLDFAYSRWVLSWLEDAQPAVLGVARALRPGAAFALQEYLDWGSMRLVPREPAVDRAVEACMQSWRDARATIDIAEHLPRLAEGAGLRVDELQPVARAGRAGSLEWRWIADFLHDYLPRLVARGGFERSDLDAFRDSWSSAAARGAWCVAPTVADVVLRKPA